MAAFLKGTVFESNLYFSIFKYVDREILIIFL